MIWIDIATPKYALFFAKLIPYFNKKVLITTRYSTQYNEAKEILDIQKIKYRIIGSYGGNTKKEKFLARNKRAKEFIKLFEKIGYPKLFISGSVADSTQVAYGLGIPIINFNDTPIALTPNYKNIHMNLTPVSRLTIPFSDIVFYPFILPSELFQCANKALRYNFIDVCLWMQKIKKVTKNDFRKKYDIPIDRPTILIREEEYKAHYTQGKKPFVYELINKLKNKNFNIVIIPRYESIYLKKEFPFTYIIDEKLEPKEIYPFIDFFVGGGGTMTLEAIYYGIPTISLRSIWLIHDKYLIDNNMMFWTNNTDDAYIFLKQNIGKKFDNKRFFCKDKCTPEKIAAQIKEFYETKNL